MGSTRQVMVGTVAVGGGAPVSVQSMTNTDTGDTHGTLTQIEALAAAGCDIVRVAVALPDHVPAFARIAAASPLPVIADVHFDWRLAVAAIDAGAHGVRINPGNIGADTRVRRIGRAAAARGIPVRVGVNGGSLDADLLEAHGGATPEALVESACRSCALLEECGCQALKVSLKSSDVRTTVRANRLMAARTDYPLHVGVTEAGSPRRGIVASAVAIGALLLDGIGDTIRVSLTADPVTEVRAALQILQAVGLRRSGPDVISCPTCARTSIDLVNLVNRVEDEIARLEARGLRVTLDKIALMGCVVNGPGEARDADVGIAGSAGEGVLFRHGKVVKRVPQDELLALLLAEIARHTEPLPGRS